MKELYLYIVNPFSKDGHIPVLTLYYYCRTQAELQRRAIALEKALNVKSAEKYIVRLSRIEDVQPVQGELPF
jgi:hypothetical protein